MKILTNYRLHLHEVEYFHEYDQIGLKISRYIN